MQATSFPFAQAPATLQAHAHAPRRLQVDKMFLKIPESNYNRIALERNTKDLFKKLKTKPLEVADKPIEMEIIPFEMLWEMVLESLDRRSPRRRKGLR